MDKTLKKLKQILRAEMPRLTSEFDVERLEIFGSFVRGQQNINSDLDILVTFKVTPGMFKFIQLKEYLSDVLGIKVDRVMRSALKKHRGSRIISEAVSL